MTFPRPFRSWRRGASPKDLVGGQAEITAITQALRTGRCCRFLGPRYHHKSQIMLQTCQHVQAQLGCIVVYVSMWEARVTPQAAFYDSFRDRIAEKIRRYGHQRLRRHAPVYAAPELSRFLAELPGTLKSNVILFVDDLEMAPAGVLTDLLAVLRAAYETASPLRFQVVVGAANSLARTALSSVSPFENISSLVTVQDLSEMETRQLARHHFIKRRPTTDALDLVVELTRGDRCLVDELCLEITRVAPKTSKTVTRAMVAGAAESLVAREGGKAITEEFHQIETNLDLLQALLRLRDGKELPLGRLGVGWGDLAITAFVKNRAGLYSLKSPLHKGLLEHHFTAERILRQFAAAGDWEDALPFLAQNDPDVPGRVMLQALTAMQSKLSRREAYDQLVRGITRAYTHPPLALRIFELDPEREALVPVPLSRLDMQAARQRPIPLRRTQRDEIWALTDRAQDRFIRPAIGHQLELLVPLRDNGENLGLICVQGLVTEAKVRHEKSRVDEFVGYMHLAARALKMCRDFELQQHRAEQRAADVHHLSELTQQLLQSAGDSRQVLEQMLTNALGALHRKAQKGSIYLYNRRTGHLEMCVGRGFPPEVVAAAKFRPGQGLAGHVYLTGKSFIVETTASDHYYQPLPQPKGLPTVRSAIGVPLMGRNGPIGVLCLDNLKTAAAFDRDSEQLLTLFANQATPWLENVRSLEMLRALNGIIPDLRTLWSSTPHPFYNTLANRLLSTFEVNGCAIGLRLSTDHLDFVVRQDIPGLPDSLPLADLPADLNPLMFATSPAPRVIEVARAGESWDAIIDTTAVGALIVAPLIGERGVHGLILLACVSPFHLGPNELDLLSTFAGQVTVALENSVHRVNLDLEYISDSSQHVAQCAAHVCEAEVPKHREGDPWPSRTAIERQVFSLLGQLFFDAKSLYVKAPLKGFSGSAALSVKPHWDPGRTGQPEIIKIGRRDKVEREQRNYEANVARFLRLHFAVLRATKYTSHLGGLHYSLIQATGERTVPFDEYYARHSAADVITTLQHLFGKTCGAWYSNTRTPRKPESLSELYLAAFQVKLPRLRQAVLELRPDMDEHAPDLVFASPRLTLPNPLHWLANPDATVMDVARSITHGDMHAGNILIDQANQAWLIDFLRTYESHTLRDFVVLETDLKFRLTGELPIDDFVAVEVYLTQLNPLGSGAPFPILSEEASKLVQVLVSLRDEARKLAFGQGANDEAAQKEYLISLLMATLNILRLRHFDENPALKPQKSRALLSAALICQRLQQLP